MDSNDKAMGIAILYHLTLCCMTFWMFTICSYTLKCFYISWLSIIVCHLLSWNRNKCMAAKVLGIQNSFSNVWSTNYLGTWLLNPQECLLLLLIFRFSLEQFQFVFLSNAAGGFLLAPHVWMFIKIELLLS